MRTLFVTSYFANLHNTKFGGRPSRHENYLESFVSLCRMPADFVIYTSAEEKNKLQNFITAKCKPAGNIQIIVDDIGAYKYHSRINELLGGWNKMYHDRCFEVQYGKLDWLSRHINDGYDRLYWIDMGLSHLGLWPQKYTFGHDWYTKQFYFDIFNEKVLTNINTAISNKIFSVAIDMTKNKAHGTPEERHYTRNANRAGAIHIVGGWFGGDPVTVAALCQLFDNKVQVALKDGVLYSEEQILSILEAEVPNIFFVEMFENWYHIDSVGFEHTLSQFNISFHHIFEKYNK